MPRIFMLNKSAEVEGVTPEQLAQKAAQKERAAERQTEQPVKNQDGPAAGA